MKNKRRMFFVFLMVAMMIFVQGGHGEFIFAENASVKQRVKKIGEFVNALEVEVGTLQSELELPNELPIIFESNEGESEDELSNDTVLLSENAEYQNVAVQWNGVYDGEKAGSYTLSAIFEDEQIVCENTAIVTVEVKEKVEKLTVKEKIDTEVENLISDNKIDERAEDVYVREFNDPVNIEIKNQDLTAEGVNGRLYALDHSPTDSFSKSYTYIYNAPVTIKISNCKAYLFSLIRVEEWDKYVFNAPVTIDIENTELTNFAGLRSQQGIYAGNGNEKYYSTEVNSSLKIYAYNLLCKEKFVAGMLRVGIGGGPDTIPTEELKVAIKSGTSITIRDSNLSVLYAMNYIDPKAKYVAQNIEFSVSNIDIHTSNTNITSIMTSETSDELYEKVSINGNINIAVFGKAYFGNAINYWPVTPTHTLEKITSDDKVKGMTSLYTDGNFKLKRIVGLQELSLGGTFEFDDCAFEDQGVTVYLNQFSNIGHNQNVIIHNYYSIVANKLGEEKFKAGWTTNLPILEYDLDDSDSRFLTERWFLYNPAIHTVTFDVVGGSPVAPMQINDNDIIQKIPKSTKAGYTFDGWYTDTKYTTKWSVYDVVFNSMTLYAKWNPKSYQVSYDTQGAGTIPSKTNVLFDQSQLLPKNLSKPGYSFKGWQYNGKTVTNTTKYNELVANDTVTEIKLVAQWEASKYQVHYDTQGAGTIPSKTNVLFDQSQLLPNDLSKPGYSFKGWQYNGKTVTNATKYSELVANDTVTEIKLVAQWEAKKYQVLYDTQGAGTIPSKTNIMFDQSQLLPNDPSKAGYSFKGWQYNGKMVTNATKYSELVADDTVTEIKLVAQWEAKKYRVSYDTQGAGTIPPKIDVLFNQSQLLPVDPVKAGYVFMGWKYNGKVVTNTTKYSDLVLNKASGEVTLVAQWETKKYQVFYDTQGAGVIPPKTDVLFNQSQLLPQDPVKAGYLFKGWQCNGKVLTDDTTYSELVANDTISEVKLIAKWEAKRHSITFMFSNPSKPENMEPPKILYVHDGDFISEPEIIVPIGWKFEGWFLDENYIQKYNFNTMTDSDLVLYAKWVYQEILPPNIPDSPKNPDISEAPETGDTNRLYPYYISIIFSGAAMMYAVRKKMKSLIK